MDIVQLSITEDAAQLVTLLDCYIAEGSHGRAHIPAPVREQLLARLPHRDNSLALIARDCEAVVGAVVGNINRYVFMAAPSANVHFIFVRTQWQRRAVARQLMQAFEDAAHRAGCGKVNIELRHTNERAKQLYRSLGYLPGTAGPSHELLEFWEKRLTSDTVEPTSRADGLGAKEPPPHPRR